MRGSGELCDYTEEEIVSKAFDVVINRILTVTTQIVLSEAFKSSDKTRSEVKYVEFIDKTSNVLLNSHELVYNENE